MKLYIVRACIFQDHAMIEGLFLDFKRRQRRIFQLAQAPFVRIGDEGYALRLDDFIDVLPASRKMFDCPGINFHVGNQQFVFNQFVIQPRLDEMIVVLLIAAADGSEERAVHGKEKAARIAERTGEAAGCQGQVLFFTVLHGG